MVLTALKPAAELRTTPPRLFPVDWRIGSFADGARRRSVSGVAPRIPDRGRHLDGARGRRGGARRLPHARHRFRGRTAFLLLVLVTQMFSPTALVVGLYREFFDWGLVNTYAALILTNAAFNLAFAVWMLRGFFASIPREIEEAAAVDGCGRLGVLLRVVLPLARPAIATALIFSFIAAWNEYVVALTLMTDAARRPLTVGITSYVTAYVQHWNLLFAASVIALVARGDPVRADRAAPGGGLTAGSVK